MGKGLSRLVQDGELNSEGEREEVQKAGGSQEQAQEDFGGQGSWLSSIC